MARAEPSPDRGQSHIRDVLTDLLPEVLVPGWHGEAGLRIKIADGRVQVVYETRDRLRRVDLASAG